MEYSAAIRERRDRAVQRALSLLDLYGASDAATRGSLIPVASQALGDARVAERWIAVLAKEADPGLRRDLLRPLAALDFRQVPRDDATVAVLAACLDAPDARDWALHALSRLAPQDPRLALPMISAVRGSRDDAFVGRVLDALLGSNDPPAEVLDLFLSVLDQVDAERKLRMVRRLLEHDRLPLEAAERLLRPTEPEPIKIVVLDHWIDRSIRNDERMIAVLRNDPHPPCRYAAVWALTETGALPAPAIDALLAAATGDPDPRVRELALASFEHTLPKTPVIVRELLASLCTETSESRVSLILRLLAPYLDRSPEIVPALTALLEGNLSVDVALEIYAALGALAPWRASLHDWLLDAFLRERDDRVKAAILAPLAQSSPDEPRMAALCREAIRLPDPELRRWGARGIAALPAVPEHEAAFEAAAGLLLSPDLPSSLCLELAHKLAILPQKSAGLRARLADAAARTSDEGLRRVCEAVGNEELSSGIGGASRVDWDDWVHRAEVEHRADGIFPALYEHYAEAPDAARRILKALLLPQCSNSLYSSYGYEVGEWALLDFLDRKNAIDDDISRFCIGRVLTQDAGTPNGLLEFLPSNPGYPGLRDGFWTILERRADADPALLRRILITAYGDEDAAAREFAERMAKSRGVGALRPYLRFMMENLGWEPTRGLLVAFLRHPDLDAELRKEVRAARTQLGIQESPDESKRGPAPGPGFADE